MSTQGTENPKYKKWTMLAYMAGDNNLTEEMVWALQSMRRTLETNSEVQKNVGVIAQYDASGLNPCLLLLGDNLPATESDGALEMAKVKEFTLVEAFERAPLPVEPSDEHWAIAIMAHHGGDKEFKALIGTLTGNSVLKISVDQAKRFITDLIACDGEIRDSILDKQGKLALAVAQTLTTHLVPAKSELDLAKKAVTKNFSKKIRVGFHALKDKDLRQRPAVTALARRLVQSSDSIVRKSFGLASPDGVEKFIGDQTKLVEDHKLTAEHYMVVLSGHGGGVTGEFLPDEDPPRSLTIPRLGEMLRKAKEHPRMSGKSLDILGMDSCLMNMAEVAYEVQDSVDYMVAGEGFVPNAGWPYHRVLEVLSEGKNPVQTAKELVQKYAAFYQDYEMAGSSTHLAVLDLRALGRSRKEENKAPAKEMNLATAIRLLARSLTAALKLLDENEEQEELKGEQGNTSSRAIRDAVTLAHWSAQSYKWGEFIDLWDFCGQLLRFLPKSAPGETRKIREFCRIVQEQIDKAVRFTCYSGPEFQHSHGVSVYFPWSAQHVAPAYRALKFAEATGWFDFLDTYLKRTRRLRRAHIEKAVPRRFGSDVDLLAQGVDPQLTKVSSYYQTKVASYFGSKVASYFGTKVASYFGTKVASPFGTKVSSPFETRVASPFGTKMQDGKVLGVPDFKNLPDGYFRQDFENPKKFLDKKGNGHPDPFAK
jgi:hypothetical protein